MYCPRGFRYLDPDPPTLLSELDQTVNKKFHKLNKAITTLVSVTQNGTLYGMVKGQHGELLWH